MPYWQSRGLRGSTLEEMVNLTNDQYMEHGLACIEKIPTPIKPVKLGKEKGTISLAYFEKKGSVDYIGAIQGYPVCFDAKETGKDFFPLKNIHEHQMVYMRSYVKQQGIAFLLVSFTGRDMIYLLPFEILDYYWQKAKEGGRKSIPHEAFDSRLEVKGKSGYLVHYLEAVAAYIEMKERDIKPTDP